MGGRQDVEKRTGAEQKMQDFAHRMAEYSHGLAGNLSLFRKPLRLEPAPVLH